MFFEWLQILLSIIVILKGGFEAANPYLCVITCRDEALIHIHVHSSDCPTIHFF